MINQNMHVKLNYIYPKFSFENLVENFSILDDWEDRYSYIIELGDKIPEFPGSLKVDKNKVSGCMSQVWMVQGNFYNDPEKFAFAADSDSRIVKGLIYILATIYTGQKKRNLISVNESSSLMRLGLEKHLSIGRRNGFDSMVQKIKSHNNTA